MVYQAIRLSKDMVWVVEELDEQYTPCFVIHLRYRVHLSFCFLETRKHSEY